MDINSILQSSAIPSENDIDHIKLQLSECEAEMSNLNKELHTELERLWDISGLKVKFLPVKRENWITQLHACDVALCSATRLPTELIAEIFLHIRSSQKLRGTPFDSVFLSICRRWRNIAISTPALWSEMELELCKLEPRFLNQMALLQTWCERAGPLPLSITLSLRGHDIPSEVNPIPTLLYHRSHISTLRLTLPFAHFRVLFVIPGGFFPYLEVLDCCSLHDDVRTEDPQFPVNTFKSAYRLRSMRIESPSDYLVLRPPPQLSELILRIYLLDIPDCLDILRDCPYLEMLELQPGWDPEDVVTNVVVLLPCLRKFTLNVTDYNTCGVMFDHITLPALRELILDCDGAYQPWCHPSFQSLASRSSWNVERFTICCTHMQFYQSFSSLPSLIELNIDHIGEVDEWIFAALTYKMDAVAPLLPKLQKFKLEIGEHLEDGSEAFVDMVESRWWPDTCGAVRAICRLQEVTLIGTDGLALDESQLSRLRKCRREGLVVDCPEV